MRNRNDGFTLFFVIIFLSLVGLGMALLANMSKNFADKTVENELRVYTRQLLYSARAWADANIERLAGMNKGQSVELDGGDFSVRQSKCVVKVIQIDTEKIVAQLSAGCSKGRLNVTRTIEATFSIAN